MLSKPRNRLLDSNMEEEMNLHPAAEFNIDQVVNLIEILYNSNDPSKQAEADRKLIELQSSNNVWQLCWPLLDPNRYSSVAVHFFAANTLVTRINQSWSQLDEEWLENHLRPRLFETLLSYAGSPYAGKLVIERLSIAIATFALHSMPTFWPDAVENILQTFTPQNLQITIPSERICDILLKILMYIPEEYSVLTPRQDHRAKLNCQITKSGPIVFRFLHSLLMADKSMITLECKQAVLKCITSWTLHSRTSLLEIDCGKTLLEVIYNLIVDEELCAPACAALGATFDNQKSESFRNSVIDFIPKIAGLKQAIDKYTLADEMESAIRIYSLVINFSENHTKLFIQIVLEDGIQLEPERSSRTKQAIFTIIRTILDCTSAQGIYGMDEKYSDLSFAFWFSFFENFYYYQDTYNDIICETFDPLVDTLLQTFITKAKYPSSMTYYQTWNDDQREAFRCYRQDLGDNISLIIQFPRSRLRILANLHDQLAQELTLMHQTNPSIGEVPWQGLESVVFALKSIAEAVPFDESKYVPKIFDNLCLVPFMESYSLLYCAIAEMISAFSDWLYTHDSHLSIAFKILFIGVNSSDSQARLMSTLSLKDLTSECQTVLQPFASDIVKSCTATVSQSNSRLTTNEKSRLMHAIGTTLAMLQTHEIAASLATLTMPLLTDISEKVKLDPKQDLTCRSVILDRLTMLNSLIESLYVKQYSGNEYESEGDENDARQINLSRFSNDIDDLGTIQPALGLLEQIIPLLSVIIDNYRSDEELIDIISNTIKRSAKSLGTEVRPVLEQFLMLIVNAYDPLLNPNILEASIPLYMLFRVDQNLRGLFQDNFTRISDKTLQVCLSNPLRQLSLTIEHYFRYATFVCKRFSQFITDQSSAVKVEYIYKLAIASLELPEKRTLSEVCNFLCLFRQKSIGVEHLTIIFVNHLDVMISNIFNIFGGYYSTPRNAIEHVTEVLYSVIDADEAKAPLKLVVEKENFPTGFVKQEQKLQFVSRIVHEKNRKKFKDACAEFVLIVRNLNRSV